MERTREQENDGKSEYCSISGQCKVCIYRSTLCNGDPVEFEEYRSELNGCMRFSRKVTILIIWFDLNSSVGNAKEREEDEVASDFGLGRTNEAGKGCTYKTAPYKTVQYKIVRKIM